MRDIAPGTVLEASGGLTLDTARAVAATGVDLLAVGALTHSTGRWTSASTPASDCTLIGMNAARPIR